ncbi:unnamed protein product [Vicia faba]|uniref:Uncharacterized protein n=1 Tax=Vicia faba TaxID=3906 RepID=A0AAV1AVW1_VICFA|nr:unnamed protein product [Vicia faba]
MDEEKENISSENNVDQDDANIVTNLEDYAIKKKANKKKDTLKLKNTPTKRVATPKSKKKGVSSKNNKDVASSNKPAVKKKSIHKRKVYLVVEISKEDVEDIMILLVKKNRKKMGRKRSLLISLLI